jgi:hypothetical protein
MSSSHGSRHQSAANTNSSTADTDSIEEVHLEEVRRVNPFATPYGSTPASRNTSTTGFHSAAETRWFRSRRVKKGEFDKGWSTKKDPKEKWVTIIPVLGILFGLAVSGVLVWDGLRSITNHVYCPVLNENWSGGWNDKIWTKEAEVGGFG